MPKLKEIFKGIADAIREQRGSLKTMTPSQMIDEIKSISPTDLMDSIIDGTMTYIRSNAEKVLCLKNGSYSNVVIAEFPNAVEIGQSQFQGCQTLERFDAPNAEILGDYSLYNCGNLKYVNIPKLTYLPGQSFLNCFNLEEVSLPLITQVKTLTFLNCQKLEKFDFDFSNITLIGESAFNNCFKLNVYKLNADTIEANAFNQCSKLTDITFLNISTSIAATAFAGCNNLTYINVPWSEGEVAGAPWGAVNATVIYNSTTINFEIVVNGIDSINEYEVEQSMTWDRFMDCGWSKELEKDGITVYKDDDNFMWATYNGKNYRICTEDDWHYQAESWYGCVSDFYSYYLVEKGAAS